ncbi:hypothetical protein L596_019512 [Steinernema carpocapsae]|uniref:Uncharacterized protein n=1 Tax=Steinernema carpocapsae TaxID=34508 RepID=A0A4V6A0L4_STECR|nr:hypothetical protein L596_019512 [Steinernema carpocapsae]
MKVESPCKARAPKKHQAGLWGGCLSVRCSEREKMALFMALETRGSGGVVDKRGVSTGRAKEKLQGNACSEQKKPKEGGLWLRARRLHDDTWQLIRKMSVSLVDHLGLSYSNSGLKNGLRFQFLTCS